jgi:hypothetical protein
VADRQPDLRVPQDEVAQRVSRNELDHRGFAGLGGRHRGGAVERGGVIEGLASADAMKILLPATGGALVDPHRPRLDEIEAG